MSLSRDSRLHALPPLSINPTQARIIRQLGCDIEAVDAVIKDYANDVHTRILNISKEQLLQYQPDLI